MGTWRGGLAWLTFVVSTDALLDAEYGLARQTWLHCWNTARCRELGTLVFSSLGQVRALFAKRATQAPEGLRDTSAPGLLSAALPNGHFYNHTPFLSSFVSVDLHDGVPSFRTLKKTFRSTWSRNKASHLIRVQSLPR